jgi:hypothetical protein
VRLPAQHESSGPNAERSTKALKAKEIGGERCAGIA